MKLGMAVVLLLTIAAPATAQLPDPLGMTTDPADRAVMAEAMSIVGDRSPDIAKLDAVLAKLPRPTPLRGMIQTVRAAVLASSQKAGPAVAAVEDALRLLPDDPRPKLVATSIYTFAGAPGRAADLWLQASRESPDIAREIDRYAMNALIGRLRERGDIDRADRLDARLGEIGYSAGLAPERSGAAFARTRAAMTDGRTAEAVQIVTSVTDPEDLLAMYIDRRFAPLWPRIAEWAGADLAQQSRRYLEELRRDWATTSDFDTATPYARQLASADAYDAVVKLFLPTFDRLGGNGAADGAVMLAPIVARSLYRVGRAAEALALLGKVAATLPAYDGGTGLNIDGTYITLAAMNADWPQVIALADRFLMRAESLGDNVDRTSSRAVLSWRVCALWRTGKIDAAQQGTAELLLVKAISPGPALHVLLCRGDIAAARALMVSRLEDETTRGWALRFVQPHRPDRSTPLDRLLDPLRQAVRTAPDVVAAANRVGRILPQPIGTDLPAGFDPFRALPTQHGAGPDAT